MGYNFQKHEQDFLYSARWIRTCYGMQQVIQNLAVKVKAAPLMQCEGPSDAVLLMRYRAGRPPDVFAQIVYRHSSLVYATCYRVLRNRHLAEDAAQATFIVLFKKIDLLHESTLLSPWLYAAAQACARNIQRGQLRRINREQKAMPMMSHDKQFADPPCDAITEHLDEALCSLPKVQRDAIVLRYLNGLSEDDAAREMNCPAGTIHSRVSKGLSRLRELFVRRGLVVSSVALVAIFSQQSAYAAPAALSGTITSACVGATGASVTAVAAADTFVTSLAVAKFKAAMLIVALTTSLCAVTAVSVHSLNRADPAPPSAPAALVALEPENTADRAPKATPEKQLPVLATAFVRDFDAIPPEDTTPNDLVRLDEGGAVVSAIVSKKFTAGNKNWNPDVHIEIFCFKDGKRMPLFTVGENFEVRIRIKSEKPGKWYFSQQPVDIRSHEEAIASELHECDGQWRTIVLRAADLTPYRRPHVHTADLVSGMGINGIALYGFGTSKLFVDKIEIMSTPRELNPAF
jgi:RNA polymerase sigma factor (sigma-70 family)